MEDQQNTEPKTTDVDGPFNNDHVSSQDLNKKQHSWFSKFSMIIAICNLCIGIPFGVWYINQMTSQTVQVEASKLKLDSYSSRLQADFMKSLPDLNVKAKRQALELKRLNAEVERLNGKYQFPGATFNPDASMFVWQMRDLILGFHKYPLDSVQKKAGLTLLHQLRASADSVKFGADGKQVIESLDQDLVFLRQAKIIDVSRIEQGLRQLLELANRLQVSDSNRPSFDVPRIEPPDLATDWVVLRNIWQEIKSVIQVRQLKGPDPELNSRYFVLEKFRLKVLEMEYLFNANQMVRLGEEIESLKNYVQTHFDLNDPEVRVVLDRIKELHSMVDVPVPSFTLTLTAIENYFKGIPPVQADAP